MYRQGSARDKSRSNMLFTDQANKRIEPMTKSAAIFVPDFPGVGALLVMAHPGRSADNSPESCSCETNR